MEELKAYNKDTIVAIAGNKVDMNKLDISEEEVLAYAEEQNSKHFYTSASTGEGLNEVFQWLTKQVSKRVEPKETIKNKRIVVKSGGGSSNNNNQSEKSNCC